MIDRLSGLALRLAILALIVGGLSLRAAEMAAPGLSPLPQLAESGSSIVGAIPTPVPGPPLVPFEKLLALLPPAPGEWTAETPQGSTTDTDVFKLTTAQRSYHKGDSDTPPTASITIIDFARNQTYLDSITTAWQLKVETPDGYDRPVEIDGIRGFEHYAKPVQGSSLSILVADRFYIQIELTREDPKELRNWLKRIDLKKLAELK